MLKEKINKIFKDEGNSKKKIENLVFFLLILIVTIIAINMIWKDDKKINTENNNDNSKKLASQSQSIDKKDDSLEADLENILSNINGVGKVNVLLTYNETEELIPVYNKKNKESVTNEVDSEGGTRILEETDKSEEVVYENNEIITQKKISPKIEGAIITASGANNSTIKANIIQAVEAATRISYT